MKKKIIKNLLKNQNIVNYNVWTIDETFFSSKICIFLILNLKSRAIVAYAVKKLEENEINKLISNEYNNVKYKVGLTSDELLDLYEYKLAESEPPRIIHSDNSPTYSTPKIQKKLKEYGIKISFTDEIKNSNQASESINNIIKTNLLKLIQQKRLYINYKKKIYSS